MAPRMSFFTTSSFFDTIVDKTRQCQAPRLLRRWPAFRCRSNGNRAAVFLSGENQADPTHSAVLGLKLEEKLKATGVEVILLFPSRSNSPYATTTAYLLERLRK